MDRRRTEGRGGAVAGAGGEEGGARDSHFITKVDEDSIPEIFTRIFKFYC